MGTHSLIAQAMPSLADDLCGSVEVYLVVSESGDVEFFRICKSVKSLTRSGKIPRSMLPRWARDNATEIFAAIQVESARVSSATKVTAKRPACRLLQELQSKPDVVFDA